MEQQADALISKDALDTLMYSEDTHGNQKLLLQRTEALDIKTPSFGRGPRNVLGNV